MDNLKMFWEAVRIYQTLIAGLFATMGAIGGGALLYFSTKKQIRAGEGQEKRNKIHEEIILAKTLLAEINANFHLFDDLLKAQNLKELTSALNGYFFYDLNFPKPLNLVFKANVGRLGLLGKETASNLLKGYYYLDLIYNRFAKIVSTWDPQREKEFLAKFEWKDDFQIIISTAQLNLVLCQRNLEEFLKEKS